MSYRETTARRMLICDTSLNLPRYLSMYSRRLSKFWFYRLSNVLEIFEVMKKLADFFVETVLGIKIIAIRFSRSPSLTGRGALPSRTRKIVDKKCSPCRENVVFLQRMSAVKCVLLSPS